MSTSQWLLKTSFRYKQQIQTSWKAWKSRNEVRMNDEGWTMKNDDFKLLRGFGLWQMNERTNRHLWVYRVAFATENSIFITKTLQGLTVEEKQQYFETFVISHLMSMSSIVTNLLMYGLLNKNFRNGLSSIRRRHNPGTGETAV